MKPLILLSVIFSFFACQQPKTSTNITKENNTMENQKSIAFKKMPPDWAKNAVLYEVNLRQYTKEGTINAFAAHLPRLKAMGVDVIWLMPIFSIGMENRKGALGSPYSVKDYKAVNPEYGTIDDIKSLVKKAHDLGMKLILDWVPNHTAWDNAWLKQHPEWYTQVNGKITEPLNENGSSTGWTDCADLNYANSEMRQEMIKSMQYWIKEADIDGFRMDMAGLVPNSFWEEVRPVLQNMKPIFMLAEWQDEPKHFESCFEANYGWVMHHLFNDIAQGKAKANRIQDEMLKQKARYLSDAYQLQFITNHDENTWSGSEYERMGAAVDAFTTLYFTYDGIPLIYSGQEAAMKKRLPFFEKDAIDWSLLPKEEQLKTLIELKHKNQAVWNGVDGGLLKKITTSDEDDVFAFMREKNGDRVVVIINLSKEAKEITLQGDFFVGDYVNVFMKGTTFLNKNMSIKLPAWGYIVLSNK